MPITPETFGDCPIKETGNKGTLVIIHDNRRINDPVFCYETIDGTKVEIQNQKAVESIRSFTHNPELLATLKAVQSATNGPNMELVAIYADAEYNVFEIELGAYHVTEERSKYTNNAELPIIADSEKLTFDELRSRAHTLMLENTPNFASMESHLVYEEAQKNDAVFFFRWSDPIYTKWQHMPPFAQVGFLANGEIVSYVN